MWGICGQNFVKIGLVVFSKWKNGKNGFEKKAFQFFFVGKMYKNQIEYITKRIYLDCSDLH